jgi:hypothetical protein
MATRTGGDFHGFAYLAPNLETMCIYWKIFVEVRGRYGNVVSFSPRDVPSAPQHTSSHGDFGPQTLSKLKNVNIKLVDGNWSLNGNAARNASQQLRNLVRLVQFPHLESFALSFVSWSMLPDGDREACLWSLMRACNECRAPGLKNVEHND